MSWLPGKKLEKAGAGLLKLSAHRRLPFIGDVLNFLHPVNIFQVAHGFYCNL